LLENQLLQFDTVKRPRVNHKNSNTIPSPIALSGFFSVKGSIKQAATITIRDVENVIARSIAETIFKAITNDRKNVIFSFS
jgi:hypothetical protein